MDNAINKYKNAAIKNKDKYKWFIYSHLKKFYINYKNNLIFLISLNFLNFTKKMSNLRKKLN